MSDDTPQELPIPDKSPPTKTAVSRRTIFLWLLGIVSAEVLASGATWQKSVSTIQALLSQARLEPDPRTFQLTILDVPSLLNNSPQAINHIKQQVRGQSFLQGRSVGNTIVYGGAPNDALAPEAQQIAGKIYDILRQLGQEGFAFQSSLYGNNLFILGQPLNEVNIGLYLFKQ